MYIYSSRAGMAQDTIPGGSEIIKSSEETPMSASFLISSAQMLRNMIENNPLATTLFISIGGAAVGYAIYRYCCSARTATITDALSSEGADSNSNKGGWGMFENFSFFAKNKEKKVNAEQVAISDAYTAYIKVIGEQIAEIKNISAALDESLQDGNAALVKLARLVKPYRREQQKVVMASSSQEIDLLPVEIRKMFANYPQLPENANLSSQEISTIQDERIEHHQQTIDLVIEYLAQRKNRIQTLDSEIEQSVAQLPKSR